MDGADLDLQYLAGEIAMGIFTQLPTKSGRRKVILSQEHGQMKFEDLDMDRLTEFNNGNYGIDPQNIIQLQIFIQLETITVVHFAFGSILDQKMNFEILWR